jgi:hypothetical protein
MRNAADLRDDYLRKFELLDERYGGAIPLRGAHGSGKTHLLSWLGLAKSWPRSAPTVVYAKVDRASFFDLFSQMITQLPQERLQQLIGEALQQLAIETAGKAKATEDLRSRILTPADVTTLADEGNLDRSELSAVLTGRLETQMKENQVSPEITRALMKVDSPTLGERAYQWLQGKRVDGLQDLGLSHYLGELAQDAQGSSVPDLAAIDALETIAALHQFANRPLILLVDQLEVFVRDVDKERRQMLASLIKKLMEQLGRQNALMFIAGTDDVWDALPRDVSPRLRVREPLPVGRLDDEETRIFLEAFTRDTPRFNTPSIRFIHHLSGGNPREIIRIAYQAFERLSGDLDRATYEDLVNCAAAAGTVADRQKNALAMADRVLGAFGQVSQNLAIDGGCRLDRLLMNGNSPSVALETLSATDQLSEVQSARQVPVVVGYLKRTWPGVPLIVVTVGYSSTPVAELLGQTGAVLEFEEETFSSRLQTCVVELLSSREKKDREEREAHNQPADSSYVVDALEKLSSRLAEREHPVASADPALVSLLQRVSSRLDALEVSRKAAADDVAESFTANTLEYARPELEKRELHTKWDLLDELDRLADAASDGNYDRERQIIRGILVANEASLRLKYLDQLGGFYLDLIAQSRFASDPFRLVKAKRDLILEMRRLLRDRTVLDILLGDRQLYSLIGGAATGCVYAVVVVIYASYHPEAWGDSNRLGRDLAWQAPLAGLVFGLAMFYYLTLIRSQRAFHWEWARRALDKPSESADYESPPKILPPQ